ncbi:MAG: cobalamin B12-binding domain-containing protein [archaeon]|nr:cobalamin B12-binding domain-containing protein [archaeon]MCP8313967.1 cobalamin B12-binding domain-containing protein [archaeon]
MRVLFIEPPKDFWFIMGEYLPPPYGILQLAAFLESKNKEVEIKVLDCQAERLDWKGLERRIESFDPDIVASSGLATCNTYTVAQTCSIVKKVKPDAINVVGGQHFTVTAQESLKAYPEIDVIIHGEGEQTLLELVNALIKNESLSQIKGISFRHDEAIIHNPERPLIENLDDLPFPGYHFVEDLVHRYHFTMMAGPKTRYALIEGSRGCPHRCTFCTQWKHWNGKYRAKSAKRITDEIEFCYRNYGGRFFWLTDDNFGMGKHMMDLCDEIIRRGFSDDIMWFFQARCDDIVRQKEILPKMRKAGNRWILFGAESNSESTLKAFNKKIDPEDSKIAVKLLKENDIFAQATFIIGERGDSAGSIARMREFADDIDPDIAIFMILTPFPGTEVYEKARLNGWIEDNNWANYDMVHAIMPTEHLSREEVQEELYECYRSFYGSFNRRLKGIFSKNKLKRRTYRYMASQSIMRQLKSLFLR